MVYGPAWATLVQIKDKGPGIYIPPVTRKPEQQWLIENAPILVLTLDWGRSERIGIGPGLVKVLTPIWR